MDYTKNFDKVIGQMEWGDVVDTLNDVIGEMVSSNPQLSNSPPPAVPEFHSHHQPVENLPEGSVITALDKLDDGQDPQLLEKQMITLTELDSGNAACIFGQTMMAAPQPDLPYHPAVGNLSEPSTITSNSAALPRTVVQNLVPVQLLNGEMGFIVMEDGSNFAAPSLHTSVTKQRKCKEQQNDNQPYIKKPPNAFMLFRKEQRPNVVAELNIRDCAAVNKVLGQKWKMLSKEEQAKYYAEAAKESLLHEQNYPGWSTSQNYGKKRKRQRRKAPATADSTEHEPRPL